MLIGQEIKIVTIDEKDLTPKQNEVLKLRNSVKSMRNYSNKMVTIYPNKEKA